MRKLKYYVACTLDGFIAEADGSFEKFPWDETMVADFFESLKAFDVVLMGRKTYEVGLNAGKTNPYPTLKSYVFSRTMPVSPDKQVELVAENAVERVKKLKQETGQDIWLCGGAELATQLFAARLIDELILKLNPVLFGDGISLFSRVVDSTPLKLIESKQYDSGIMVLRYEIQNLDVA